MYSSLVQVSKYRIIKRNILLKAECDQSVAFLSLEFTFLLLIFDLYIMDSGNVFNKIYKKYKCLLGHGHKMAV